MSKPSDKMKQRIVGSNLYLLNEIDKMADLFDQAYSFNQEPAQEIVDIMFEVYISGILTGRQLSNLQGCGTTRCATCTGSCGK
jgi:heterodisulfide reductase subunit C